MTPTCNCRFLTPGEIAFAVSEEINTADINEVVVFFFAPFVESVNKMVTWSGNVYIGPLSGYPQTFHFALQPTSNAQAFVHELKHVYQMRSGQLCWNVCISAKEAIATSGSGSPYTHMPITPGKNWNAYNIEQEAEMVANRFVLHRGFSVRTDLGNGAVTLTLLNGVPGIPHA